MPEEAGGTVEEAQAARDVAREGQAEAGQARVEALPKRGDGHTGRARASRCPVPPAACHGRRQAASSKQHPQRAWVSSMAVSSDTQAWRQHFLAEAHDVQSSVDDTQPWCIHRVSCTAPR